MWVLAIALVAAFSAGVGEGISRLAGVRPFRVLHAAYTGWARRDPLLGWRNNPGVHRAHEGAHEPMTILPDGSRSSGAPAGPGPMVMVVGCSNAEGYGVRDDEVFSAILQRRFPQWHFANFATPGYGTYQSLLLLRELVEERGYRPALVVYGFIPYHAMRNVLTYYMLDAFRAFGGQRFSPPHVELHDGRLQAFPPFVVRDWPLEEHSALVSLLHSSELRFRLAGRERYQEEATRLLLVRMKQVVEKAGGHFLVATLWNAELPGAESCRRMVAGMQASGVDEVDITYAGPVKDPAKLGVGGAGGHPNGIIHAWWADRMAEWLTAHQADWIRPVSRPAY